MQHEKSDKPSGLQSKLAGLEELPGEPAPDTTALWNRLERRMEPQPNTSRRYLLWAAACVLLLAGAAALIMYRPQEMQQAIKPTESGQPPVAKSGGTAAPASPIKAASPVPQQKVVTVTINRKAPAQMAVEQEPAPSTAAEPVAVVAPPVPEAPLSALEQPATGSVAQAEKTPARKLRVVHLNEISKPERAVLPVLPEGILTAGGGLPEYRQGRSNISFSRNNSDDLIKINISPTN